MLGIGAISARKIPMALLVSTLSNYVNRQIVDRTNLTGAFDLDLRWTPDDLSVAPGAAPFPVFPFDPNGPSLQTALQEQLGLKFESQRGPVDVLVIDSVEKPSAD